MPSEDDFITHLMGFGLTEREARSYLCLLEHGPHTPSSLAKALHTYREDAHRTLTALIKKGVAYPSRASPTIYTAVELEIALESVLKKQESELREMERRKRELEGLSRQQSFRPSEEVSTFEVLKDVKQIVGVTAVAINSVEQEFLWVAPKELLLVASRFGLRDVIKALIERGGQTRAITDITASMIPLAQEFLDAGENLRHFDSYHGLYFGVFDRQRGISAVNIEINRISLEEPATMVYIDDPVYATYLASTFELFWKQAVPAQKRIDELLEQG
ncbi:MAG: TrmB family transcriptional regulator [Halobacteriota archaeon]